MVSNFMFNIHKAWKNRNIQTYENGNTAAYPILLLSRHGVKAANITFELGFIAHGVNPFCEANISV